MFPGENGDGPLTEGALYWFRADARDMAGILAGSRLHDLRHSHASHAVMNGESLHVAGRLRGHRRAPTTNLYVHLDNAALSDAAERVAVERILRIARWSPTVGLPGIVDTIHMRRNSGAIG